MEADSAPRNVADRARGLTNDLVEALSRFIVDHRVQEAEFEAALAFLTEVGQQRQFGGLADALHLSRAVDDVTYADYAAGTASNIPGPFYVPGAPELERPYRLARPEEPGVPLLFRGSVTDAADGARLAGAHVDMWQANDAGMYDVQDPSLPKMNLRGTLPTDTDGKFEVLTILPGAYQIPHHGQLGDFLRLIGRDSFFRPRHIHFKVSNAGFRPLTTQVYFQGDQWLDKDSIGEAKPELVAEPTPLDASAASRLGVASALTCTFGFRLIRA